MPAQSARLPTCVVAFDPRPSLGFLKGKRSASGSNIVRCRPCCLPRSVACLSFLSPFLPSPPLPHCFSLPRPAPSTCSNGIPGYQDGAVCCKESCGRCVVYVDVCVVARVSGVLAPTSQVIRRNGQAFQAVHACSLVRYILRSVLSCLTGVTRATLSSPGR